MRLLAVPVQGRSMSLHAAALVVTGLDPAMLVDASLKEFTLLNST